MIFDTHAHFFPDNIAQYTVELLEEESGLKAYGDGTLSSLLKQMEADGVDMALNLPIATAPDQVVSINRKMIQSNRTQNKVISFGTMHPDFNQSGDIGEELSFIASNGIKGIKMHPEYQQFYPDEDRMTAIYENCLRYNLIIYFHSGKDVGFDTVHATPERLAQVKLFSSELKVILAHMGAWKMWDDVERYLIGLHEVYFDTAFCAEMDDWQMKEVIFGHGAYKILLGSDYPWETPGNMIKKVKSLSMGAMFEKMILGGNACRLLGISAG